MTGSSFPNCHARARRGGRYLHAHSIYTRTRINMVHTRSRIYGFQMVLWICCDCNLAAWFRSRLKPQLSRRTHYMIAFYNKWGIFRNWLQFKT